MTLAEWRAAVDGLMERTTAERRKWAQGLSYQLMAAGCDADKVTPAKLLGEKEPRSRVWVDDDTRKARDAEKVIAKLRAQREKAAEPEKP